MHSLVNFRSGACAAASELSIATVYRHSWMSCCCSANRLSVLITWPFYQYYHFGQRLFIALAGCVPFARAISPAHSKTSPLQVQAVAQPIHQPHRKHNAPVKTKLTMRPSDDQLIGMAARLAAAESSYLIRELTWSRYLG